MRTWLILLFFIGGCAHQYLPQDVIDSWASVQTEKHLLASWEGIAPDGSHVKYTFNQDLSCQWQIGKRRIPCKFQAKLKDDGYRLMIHAMEGKRFKDVEFISWVKIKENKLMMYGYPTIYGYLQSGKKASWPDHFGRDSLLLTLVE